MMARMGIVAVVSAIVASFAGAGYFLVQTGWFYWGAIVLFGGSAVLFVIIYVWAAVLLWSLTATDIDKAKDSIRTFLGSSKP